MTGCRPGQPRTGLVITGHPRAGDAVRDGLGAYGVATIHEAQGRTGLLASSLSPIWRGARISGTAVTVSVAPGDNWMIDVAVEQCRAGDVLVVAPTSPSDAATSASCLPLHSAPAASAAWSSTQGAGMSPSCRQMGFPVWSRAISAEGTVKETLGDVNVPIVCGGRLVEPATCRRRRRRRGRRPPRTRDRGARGVPGPGGTRGRPARERYARRRARTRRQRHARADSSARA